MKRWQYAEHTGRHEMPGTVERMGLEGWELVQVIHRVGQETDPGRDGYRTREVDLFTFFFKRPITQRDYEALKEPTR